jgi:hypothetical protein
LTFESGTGANLVGDISLGTVTLSGLNSSFFVDAQHDVHLSGLGKAANVLANVNLSAETGAISNAANIFATNLSVSASTGIGTSGSPFLTQVSNVVAETETGGVFITNSGALTIGYASAPFLGVKVTGASGNIQITSDATVSVHAQRRQRERTWNVTIIANGASSDIPDGRRQSHDSAVESRNQGTVTLTAGRDLLLGGAANSNTGDVVSSGGGSAAIALSAGRDIQGPGRH